MTALWAGIYEGKKSSFSWAKGKKVDGNA